MEQLDDDSKFIADKGGDPSVGLSKSDAEGSGKSEQAGYSNVAKKITAWTSNLLATAVVIMIALAVGSQLVSSYRPDESASGSLNSEIVSAWPELESCALEFGDSSLQLQRETMRGSSSDALTSLQTQCRSALENGTVVSSEPGQREMNLLANVVNAEDAQPIEVSPGKWRIFRVSSGKDDELEFPMVVGVRDDVEVVDEVSANTRVAVWGLAMPRFTSEPDASDATTETNSKTATKGTSNEKGASKAVVEAHEWTTFVAVPAPESEANIFKSNLIPKRFKRTLAIANPNGGSLIGFAGDSRLEAIRFYDSKALSEGWEVSSAWKQNQDTWSARFKLPEESPFEGIQVQLHVNHNEKVRGMLLVQPN